MRLILGAILLAVGLTGAAEGQLLECRSTHKPQQVAELLFGRKIGDRLAVSQRSWARFVDREITPRFPDGLTVYDMVGQWRDAARNKIMHEPGKTVMIVLPGKDDDLERLDQVVEAYKSQFRQQSVGVILRPACVSF